MDPDELFEAIRDRYREVHSSHISPEAGEAFQRTLSSARANLDDAAFMKLQGDIIALSEDANGEPIQIGHADAVFIRNALEMIRAGVDARTRAGIAFDALRGKPANVRARAWADEFGMAEANRSVNSGDRKLFQYLLWYVYFLVKKTACRGNTTNASREERMLAARFVQRSFDLASVDSTIECLRNARENQFVRQNWPSDLLPVDRLTLPGRRDE